MKNLTIKEAYQILFSMPEFKNQHSDECVVMDDVYVFFPKSDSIDANDVALTGTVVPGINRSTGKMEALSIFDIHGASIKL